MEDIIVVKLGGLASQALDEQFFGQIQKWRLENKKIVMVHGGGKYISEMMARLNMPVEMKNGRRVTTKETLEITKMVLIGQVQPEISAKFQKENIPLLGLNAGDASLLEAMPANEAGLGFVGEIKRVNAGLLMELLAVNSVLLLAPLGIDENQQWWNVNADSAACAVASALQARTFYLLTDVPGVKQNNVVLRDMTTNKINFLIENGDVSGGMIPKLESAKLAIQSGVENVFITSQIGIAGTQIKQEVTTS
ncbi:MULTISPECIES: acetylglutamate kinase [Listeria]|uniref:acetylglutamate kinase n=1 Tax=Listeria TaxID=1637 RepID=UPI000B5972C9|nr:MULTISPECIES: acetylglutamate kinase [Listeria]